MDPWTPGLQTAEDLAGQMNAQPAPEFTLTDTAGQEVRVARYRGDRTVVLVFNRGFV